MTVLDKLESIAKVLDKVQNVIGKPNDNETAGELYDSRCLLEDIKEDIHEDNSFSGWNELIPQIKDIKALFLTKGIDLFDEAENPELYPMAIGIEDAILDNNIEDAKLLYNDLIEIYKLKFTE